MMLKAFYPQYAEKLVHLRDLNNIGLSDIELYNTKKVVFNANYLEIIAANDVIPVIYYFTYELSEADLIKVLSDVKSYCSDNTIEFDDGEDSFDSSEESGEESSDKKDKSEDGGK